MLTDNRNKEPDSTTLLFKSKGLGDTVAKVIRRITRGRAKPCSGCKKRQKKLNQLVPY